MSRPHLVELLENKQIPHRMVGIHRRIRLSDLQAFKEASNKTQRERRARKPWVSLFLRAVPNRPGKINAPVIAARQLGDAPITAPDSGTIRGPYRLPQMGDLRQTKAFLPEHPVRVLLRIANDWVLARKPRSACGRQALLLLHKSR